MSWEDEALDGRALLAGREVAAADFFASDDADRGGVRVAARDLSGDGVAEIVTGSATTRRATAYSVAPAGTDLDVPGDGLDGVYVG